MLGRRPVCIGAIVTGLIGAAAAQDVDYKSRDEFHQNTAYGTIAFNKDATNSSESRYRYKNYIVVPSDGQFKVPRQSGYCFVINHYHQRDQVQEYSYTFEMRNHFVGGQILPDTFRGSYSPTPWPGSWRMPDYCLRRLWGLTKVEIRTASSEQAVFDHLFWFEIPAQ